jgi:hypothetical protein
VISGRIQSSRFIDTPSGILDVALRKVGQTSSHFDAKNYFVRLELKSVVPRDKISAYKQTGLIKETYDTQALAFYKVADANTATAHKSRKTQYLLNETSNFLLRHYSDSLVISLY